LTDKGIKDLWILLWITCLALERTGVIVTTPRRTASELKLAEDAPFAAFVFKSVIDPFVGQLTIFGFFQVPGRQFRFLYVTRSPRKGSVS
jgi:hypothetical protein